jgi:Zn-dependent protease
LLFGNLTPQSLIANLVVLLVGMTLHEFAHNYVGYLMGDPTPAREGRLTLNPMVHINWIGWLMFALIGFGILGSAPISPYRMRNQRWGFLAAVAAGPFANLLIAIVAAIFIRIIGFRALLSMPYLFQLILMQMVYLNIILFLFNLLPLFPLDGWHIVLTLLPPEQAYSWQRHAQTTQYIFFGLLMLSFIGISQLNIFSMVIGEPAIAIYRSLLGF